MGQKARFIFRIHAFLTPLFFAGFAWSASNQNLSYQGRVVKPDGFPLEAASVTFTMSLYSPAPSSCLLYTETQTLDMTGSKGTFNLSLGSVATGLQGSVTGFNQIFINNPSFSITGLTCAVGTSYTPSLTDDRNLVVQINDGSASFTLNPVPVKSVPFALQASQISGWGIGNLVKVATTGDTTTFSTGEMANLKGMGAAACPDGSVLRWSSLAVPPAWVCSTITASGANSNYNQLGVVAIDTSAGVSGINITSGTIKLANSGVVAGTYGSTTTVPVITVDGFGRVTAVTTATISGSPLGAPLGNGHIWVGNSGVSTEVAVSGDVTLGSTGQILLNSGIVAAGTYRSVAVNAKGQVVGGSNPTTLSGFGISDAVQNLGSAPSMTSGFEIGRPAATATGTGAIYFATDTLRIFRSSGAVWEIYGTVNASDITAGTLSINQLPSVPVSKGGTGLGTLGTANQILGVGTGGTTLEYKTITAGSNISVTNSAGSLVINAASGGGSVTNVTAGSGLLGGVISSVGTISLASTGVTPGLYGAITLGTLTSVTYPQITADSYGRLTAVSLGTLPFANAGTAGILSAADWTTFNSKIDATALNNLNANNITSGTLAVARGGTGLSSGTAGGIPWFSSTTTLATSSLLTQFGVMIGGGAGGPPSTLPAMSNGQLVIGSTGASPVVGTLGQSNGILITNGAGSITLSTDGTFGATASTLVRRDVAGGFQASGAVEMVQGQIYADEFAAPAATADFSKGNVQYLNTLNFAGSAITLLNMKGGASYTVVVRDGASAGRTFTFTNCTTSKFVPLNSSTAVGADTVYSILYLSSAVAGSNTCYISWITGF